MDTNEYDGGSHVMIRNQMQLSEDLQLLAQRLDGLETQVETLVNGQQLLLETVNQMAKKDQRNKKTPAQRPRKKRQQPSANDVSKLLHLPEALQRNVLGFTDCVLFSSTDIPDELISTDCLSEDECNALLNKSSKKDQIRVLIRKIKARGPQVIKKFLQIVEKDHPHVVKDVNTSLDKILQENRSKPVCIMCVMQSTVDLRDIGDCLWAEKIISDDIYGDIYENDCFFKNKRFIWGKIIMSLNEYDNNGKAKDILVNALRAKYNYIVEYLNENPDRQSLSCSCCTGRRTRMRPLASDFGSQTDLSMTSAIPYIIYDDHLPDDIQSETSDELSRSNLHSFDLLDMYESIESPHQFLAGSQELDTVEKDKNKRQLSEHAEQQIGTEDKNIHAEKMNMTLGPIDRETTERAISFQEKPQLAHSVSTLSTASTLCPEQSPDRDSIIFSDKTELLNQEELNRISTSYNTGIENDHTDSGAENVNQSNTLQNQERADDEVPKTLFAAKNGIEAKQKNHEQESMVTANVIQCQVPSDGKTEKSNKSTTSLSNTKNQPQSHTNTGTVITIERAEESKGKEQKEELQHGEYNESQILKQVTEVLEKDSPSLLETNMENERTVDTGFGSQSNKEEENFLKDSEERGHFAPKTHTDSQTKYTADTENTLITDTSGLDANGSTQSNQAEIKEVTQYEFENKADGEIPALYSKSNNLDGNEDSSKETSVAAENTAVQISLSDNEISTTSETEVSIQNVQENSTANMDNETELE